MRLVIGHHEGRHSPLHLAFDDEAKEAVVVEHVEAAVCLARS